MLLKIKYFGMLTELTSCEEETVEFSGEHIAAFKAFIFEKHPALKQKSFRIAQNKTFVSDEALLTADEIALLPPFSGG